MAIADQMQLGIASPHIFADGRVDAPFVPPSRPPRGGTRLRRLWAQERIGG